MVVQRGRLVLGVDIQPDYIYIAELQGTWDKPKLINLDYVETPPSAMAGDRITDVGLICSALRPALARMKTRATDMYIGVAASAVSPRNLMVPPIPHNEMRALIANELLLQEAFSEPGGGFDYIPLYTENKEENGEQAVLVMTVEGSNLNVYRNLADRLGLRLVGLEPAPVGALRLAGTEITASPTTLCVTIRSNHSEIAIFQKEQLSLYRHMDTGSNQLLARRSLAGEAYSQQPFGEITFDTEPIVPPPSGMDFNAIQSLCLEVQRSMDYFHRQHPYVTSIDKVLIIPDTTELYELAGWMSEALMREVSLPTLPERLSAAHPAILETALAMNFWSAIGLAMRDVPNIPSQLPRFDFQSQYARHRPDALLRRRLALSLTASLTVLLVGILGVVKVGKMASNAYAEAEHAEEELQYLQKERKLRTEEIEKLQTLASQCKREGLPIPLIVDELANSVPSQLGWTELSLGTAGNLSLYGEARSNQDIIHYLEKLKTSKILSTVALDSFDSSASSAAIGSLVKFQVSAQIAGVQTPATLAAAPKP